MTSNGYPYGGGVAAGPYVPQQPNIYAPNGYYQQERPPAPPRQVSEDTYYNSSLPPPMDHRRRYSDVNIPRPQYNPNDSPRLQPARAPSPTRSVCESCSRPVDNATTARPVEYETNGPGYYPPPPPPPPADTARLHPHEAYDYGPYGPRAPASRPRRMSNSSQRSAPPMDYEVPTSRPDERPSHERRASAGDTRRVYYPDDSPPGERRRRRSSASSDKNYSSSRRSSDDRRKRSSSKSKRDYEKRPSFGDSTYWLYNGVRTLLSGRRD